MKPQRLAYIAMTLVLGACSNTDVRDTLGISKAAPDEFVVVSRPPLSVPPEFDLRPPNPGEPARMPSASEEARKAILGGAQGAASTGDAAAPADADAVTPVQTADAPSGAMSNFLNRAGADKADDSIRTKLNTDAVTPHESKKDDSLYDEIVGSEKKEPVVDPAKETERLKENKEAGKPAAEGEVPIQDEKPPSVLDTIF